MVDTPHSDVGDRLRRFRETLDVSQIDFARMHGFNPTQYTNWETGVRRITIENAARLEERHGLTLDFIYLGKFNTLPHKIAVALSDSPAARRTSKLSEKPDA